MTIHPSITFGAPPERKWEMEMQPATENQLDRLRALADKLDCLTETDMMLLAKATHGTVEAWRKRGTGPAYLLLGNRYLYPRKAVAQHLEGITRERRTLGKEVLL